MNMKKSALILAFLAAPLAASEALMIRNESILTPGQLGKASLFHDKAGFHVMKGSKRYDIESHNVDQQIRKLSTKDMARYLAVAKLHVNKVGKNEYTIRGHVDGKGGGFLGATAGFYLGKFGTYFVAHGLIAIAAACTGPAAPVTFSALEGMFAVPIEATSNAVAIGCGIAAGTATGPV